MRVRWRHGLAVAVAAALLLSLTDHHVGKAAQQNQTKPTAPAKPQAQTKPKPPAPQPSPSPGAALDTGAKHALILEVETGTVLEDQLPGPVLLGAQDGGDFLVDHPRRVL